MGGGLVPTGASKVGTTPVDEGLPIGGTLAATWTVPAAAVTLTAPDGAAAALAPALMVAGVIIIVPPEFGEVLLRSDRS